MNFQVSLNAWNFLTSWGTVFPYGWLLSGINHKHRNSAARVSLCCVTHTMWHHAVCQLPKCGGQHLRLTLSHYPTEGASRFLGYIIFYQTKQCQEAGQQGQCRDCAMCWMIQGLIPSRNKKCFSLKCPDQLWHPPSLLFEGTTVSFPACKVTGAQSWPFTFI